MLGAFVVFFPLGALVHVAPRFPGSLPGTLLGIVAAVLMLLPLGYVLAKRLPRVGVWLATWISRDQWLALHVYTGLLAPLLGLVHAAHKFESPLGVSLTGALVVVVASGIVGRYLVAQIAAAERGRRGDLAYLRTQLRDLSARPESPARHPIDAPVSGQATWSGLIPQLADLEFAVRAEGMMSRALGQWAIAHIIAGVLVYALLALHIWAGLYYGLRSL